MLRPKLSKNEFLKKEKLDAKCKILMYQFSVGVKKRILPRIDLWRRESDVEGKGGVKGGVEGWEGGC